MIMYVRGVGNGYYYIHSFLASGVAIVVLFVMWIAAGMHSLWTSTSAW